MVHASSRLLPAAATAVLALATAGSAADTQLGNTDAGQAGGATYSDYLLPAYYGQVTYDLPIDETLVQGQPLTISFDMGVDFPPNATDDTNWVAFRMGDVGATWPVVGRAGNFAFLYRINKGIQTFTTDSTPVEFPVMASGHFTLVFTDGDGTGSAFAGNGSQVALDNGTTLIGNFFAATTAETSTTINFTKGAADFFRIELAP